MASKRCRLLRSSSQGETGLYTHIQPLQPSVRLGEPEQQKRPQRPTIKQLEKQPQSQHQPSIFRLNSPTEEKSDFVFKEQPDEGFRAFLKCCSLCKKQLKQDGDVYMYGYLTAYCSPDCRDDQMALDGFDKKIAADREIRKMEVFGKPNAPLH
ncbi:hypothetical protein Pyn_08370 [Prunus yedoensis var. nudiflora]|uniref:FLZ-type domain-containing protein n=1 Tax=Prunus yedoensis var. nudiflora TaxID=2094558 RepID=A0A314YXH0_PRUYE|nr:hypothetical protein Pyn_08370 [Prunus yedoensis var. nudiflora]